MLDPTKRPPAPQQRRSAEKLTRILQATEELLTERVFESLTVAEIAARAKVSVGLLYTRFRGKEDLLPALLERHHREVGQRLSGLFDALAGAAAAAERLEVLVGFAVDYHLQHRGLLRALSLHAKSHPESLSAQMFQERTQQYEQVATLVVGDGTEIRHSDPNQAVQFFLRAVNSICREQLLFDDSTLTGTAEELRRELLQMGVAYLGCEGKFS